MLRPRTALIVRLMNENTKRRAVKSAQRAFAVGVAIASVAVLFALSDRQARAQQAGSRASTQNNADTQNSAGAGDDGSAGTKGGGSGGASAAAMSGQGSSSVTSTGPGGVNQHRFGGGTSTPVIDPPPVPPGIEPAPPGTQTELPALADSTGIASLGNNANENYVLGRGGLCEGYELGRMSVQERIRGANLERLRAAQRYLAPGFRAESMETPVYILANYQQLLETARPDLALAGTYLGLMATRRITAEVVTAVNNTLCLATADSQAESISQTAETQRLVAR